MVRRYLFNDAYTDWSENGVNVGGPGRIVDHGDVEFVDSEDPWETIERMVASIMAQGRSMPRPLRRA